jgi:glucokinase
MTPAPSLLIGDIGGTNARFALADPLSPAYSDEITLHCTDFETSEDAIGHYLDKTGIPEPDIICLAAAGPIVDQSVSFTNNHWSIDCRSLSARFPSAQNRLLNDFEAIAWSLPHIGAQDAVTIGLEDTHSRDPQHFNIGVLGCGTGLGVAGATVRDSGIHHIVGEGGHIGFAPENQLQLEVLKQLRERFERVSNERLLSGPGIQNIYWALRKIHGQRGTRITTREIFQSALANEDVIAAETLHLFYEALGQVAGNLALSLGANDGIYIAGGIVKRYPDLLKTSSFRSGFEAKGRHRALMEKIPTLLIMHPQPGLLGTGYCARQMHQNGAMQA